MDLHLQSYHGSTPHLAVRVREGGKMEKCERQEARIRFVKAMLAGQGWPEVAAATESLPIKRAMAYRLYPFS